MADKPKSATWVEERVEQARSLYGGQIDHQLAVEKLFTGDFTSPSDSEDQRLELIRSAKARNILRRELQMLAIRSKTRIEVAAHDNTHPELEKADSLEKLLHSVNDALEYQTQRDWKRDVAFFTLLRGRGGVHVKYNPLKDGLLRLGTHVLDPLHYFPFWTDYGIEFFVRDYYKVKGELVRWMGKLQGREWDGALPFLGFEPEYSRESIRVMEYWDDEYCAYVIEDQFIGPFHHEYGFVPIVDIRINQTPLQDYRWTSEGTLGGVKDELQAHTVMMSKLATAAEMFFYPTILERDEYGRGTFMQAAPGQIINVPDETEIQEFKPTPNHETLELLMKHNSREIHRGTIPESALDMDTSIGSGFEQSVLHNQIKDALADKAHPLERGMSQVMSHQLRLMEQMAPEQEDGGWKFPVVNNGRRFIETVTASDIDGHYDVKATIVPLSLQDRLQAVTQLKQMRGADPDGVPTIPFEYAIELAQLDQVIEDTSGLIKAREIEFLRTHDPEYQQVYLRSLRAKHAAEIQEMEKLIKREGKKATKRSEREMEREIEKSGEEMLKLPPDIWQNPQKMHEIATAIERGLNPQIVINGDLPNGLPMEQPMNTMPGVPSQQPPAPMGGQFDDIIQAFGGGGQPPPPEISPLQGFEGVNPAQLPPGLQGAIPRQQMDQPNVAVEQMNQFVERGALPPPR